MSLIQVTKVYDPIAGRSRNILIPNELNSNENELAQLFEASFNTIGNVVAFRDENDIIYPLSFLGKFPSNFIGRHLTVITTDENRGNIYMQDSESSLIETYTENDAEATFDLLANGNVNVTRDDMTSFLVYAIRKDMETFLPSYSPTFEDLSHITSLATAICQNCFNSMGITDR